MVPRRLKLRNFMAYRAMDHPIDLTGIHVACLVGANGAGKSTLLDAITWALWGGSRAKSDDDLVALGEHEMEVEFEFALGEELYRVIRKRTKAGLRHKGQSMLELFVAAGEDDAPPNFVPITGNTLRDTEAKIRGLLRLDYDTFINSALLLQGRADEFTTRRPDLRKQVLADVLGLSRYDAYAEAARDEMRRRDALQDAARHEVASLEAQVAQRPELESLLTAARGRREQAEKARAAREQAVQGLLARQRLRQERQAAVAAAQERIARIESDLRDLGEQRERLTKRISDAQAVLARREELEAALAEHREVRMQEERMARASQEVLRLRSEEADLRAQLERARSTLEQRGAVLAREVSQWQALVAEVPTLQQQAAQAAARLAALELQQAELATLRTKAAEAMEQMGGLREAQRAVERQGRDVKARRDQLQAAGRQGVCPLCGTELGEHGYERILAEYDAELQRQREVFRANARALEDLEKAHRAAQDEAARLEKALAREQAEAQAQQATAAARLADAEAAATRLVEGEAALAELRTRLQAGDFAPDTAAALAATQAALAALDYDPDAHRALRERRAALEDLVAVAQRLPEAERALQEAQQDLARTDDTLARRQQEVATERETLTRLEAELAEAPDVDAQLAAAQQQLAEASQALEALAAEIGRLEGEVERCARLEAMLQEKREQLRLWGEERDVYSQLAEAFGRRGIQALLIETALPELEDETNALLGRMTDNRLTVKLETQRQTKAGNIVETLDIKISDELGTRPYELYSGGEAFRINFALRIALSKLLARRAGAPLPTLFVDEGFGTQDAAGREKLVEAVNAIAEEFQCVLVITHVDELKDVFPARIEVEKRPNGSTATVVRA